jgi:hypothetical protein
MVGFAPFFMLVASDTRSDGKYGEFLSLIVCGPSVDVFSIEKERSFLQLLCRITPDSVAQTI